MRMQTIESSGTSRYIKSFLFGQLFGVIALFVSYIFVCNCGHSLLIFLRLF